MTEAERIASVVGQALPTLKRGTLRFWGSWFGRPMDNVHTIVGCQAEGDLLTIRFGGGERLEIWTPGTATIDERTFRIVDASRVRWEWIYYGRPHVPENRLFEEFRRHGTQVIAETNVDWGVPEFRTDISLPAVEML